MKCLRCGYCCQNPWVIIVDDPEKGLNENNLIAHTGGRCKHLRGDQPGEYRCFIHNKSWYKETPCFKHGQIERSKDDDCRIGRWMLDKIGKQDSLSQAEKK